MDVENEAKNRNHELDHARPAHGAGEQVESPTIHKGASDYLRRYGPDDLKSTYAIALRTMVFAAAQPGLDHLRITNNVAWLERAQINPTDPVKWSGSWTYSDSKSTRHGDNSNTQYALLGLHAASEAGVIRQARRVGPGARLLGTSPKEKRRLGLYARLKQPDGQHDLRRGLEPVGHRLPPVSSRLSRLEKPRDLASGRLQEWATVPDLLQPAPIVFINGHEAPEFTLAEKKNLREYVDRGGFIFAESCCGRTEFDRGFKTLMEELFIDKQEQLRPLADDHPIWRSKHLLRSETHPVWGISRRGRTVVVYSPSDLSCYWNQSERSPANAAVIKAIRVGQNVIDYATGRSVPDDRLSDP